MPDSNQLAQIMATMARVDERTLAMQKEIAELKENNADKIDSLKQQVEGLKKSMKEDYVQKESFTPVQRIVYGIVSVILTAVTMAIIGFVILK
jgi:hypothetical protein